MKRKLFNQENLTESLQLIQAAFPTDEDHPAHWWNERTGIRIKAFQEGLVKDFKKIINDCHSRKEINEAMDKMVEAGLMKWPDMGSEKKTRKFYTTGFGRIIAEEFMARFNEWSDYVNSLEGSEF